MKLATAPNLENLRGLIAQYYFRAIGDVILQGGDVFLNDKKMFTKYYNKGKRWYFIIPEK